MKFKELGTSSLEPPKAVSGFVPEDGPPIVPEEVRFRKKTESRLGWRGKVSDIQLIEVFDRPLPAFNKLPDSSGIGRTINIPRIINSQSTADKVPFIGQRSPFAAPLDSTPVVQELLLKIIADQ